MTTCNECTYKRDVHFPGQIQKQPVCTKNPPVVMMAQTPQGPALMGMQPPLPAANSCGSFMSSTAQTCEVIASFKP